MELGDELNHAGDYGNTKRDVEGSLNLYFFFKSVKVNL